MNLTTEDLMRLVDAIDSHVYSAAVDVEAKYAEPIIVGAAEAGLLIGRWG